jgi:hypothetical protein
MIMGISRKRNLIFDKYVSAGIDSGIGRAIESGRSNPGDRKRAMKMGDPNRAYTNETRLHRLKKLRAIGIAGDFNHPV